MTKLKATPKVVKLNRDQRASILWDRVDAIVPQEKILWDHKQALILRLHSLGWQPSIKPELFQAIEIRFNRKLEIKPESIPNQPFMLFYENLIDSLAIGFESEGENIPLIQLTDYQRLREMSPRFRCERILAYKERTMIHRQELLARDQAVYVRLEQLLDLLEK